jgi:hypothetical protein
VLVARRRTLLTSGDMLSHSQDRSRFAIVADAVKVIPDV